MAFTDSELTEYLEVIENVFWSKRRPPHDIRDKICEGQRLSGQSIELFFVRPLFSSPSESIEESIAKITYVRSKDEWQLYWMRATGKWSRDSKAPSGLSLPEALQVIDEDAYCCFFG